MKRFQVQKYFVPESMQATIHLYESLTQTIKRDNRLDSEEVDFMNDLRFKKINARFTLSNQELKTLKSDILHELNNRIARPFVSKEARDYTIKLRKDMRELFASLEQDINSSATFNKKPKRKPKTKAHPKRKQNEAGIRRYGNAVQVDKSLHMRQSGGSGKIQCLNCQ